MPMREYKSWHGLDDKQHWLCVKQCEKLMQPEKIPHFLTMSATPIPRTLSMALYADTIHLLSQMEESQKKLTSPSQIRM